MSEWKRFAIVWTVSIVVRFYTVFVLVQLWNWFAVPLLNVPESGYWVMYGVSMFFSLLTGRDDPENPMDDKKWRVLYIVLDACVPDHKMETVKEYVKGEQEKIWAEIGFSIVSVILVRTLTLGLGFVVHLFV